MAYQVRTMTAEQNPGLDEENPGRSNRACEGLCERTQTVRACLWRVEKGLECQRPQKLGFKTSFAQKPVGCTGTL